MSPGFPTINISSARSCGRWHGVDRYEVSDWPIERRAIGYRWENERWSEEPTMRHGAFGSMGGVQTSASDYGRWIAFLLSAWPPRDEAETGPVRRATVREMAQGSNFPRSRARFGKSGATACQQSAAYAMGLIAAQDCELGLTLSHGGGYPGYGSHMLLLPTTISASSSSRTGPIMADPALPGMRPSRFTAPAPCSAGRSPSAPASRPLTGPRAPCTRPARYAPPAISSR
jgi:hypothetical protein